MPAAGPNGPGEGDDGPLLTTVEVATRLRCSRRTVARLVEAGDLAVITVGPHMLRFRPDDVAAFLAQRYRRAS